MSRYVLLGKDKMTGNTGLYLPRTKEHDILRAVIVNPLYVKCLPYYSYFFTLDPNIPTDLMLFIEPTELDGTAISTSSVDKLKETCKANLEGVLPYRTTPSWKELFQNVTAYASDSLTDEKTNKQFEIIVERMQALSDAIACNKRFDESFTD